MQREPVVFLPGMMCDMRHFGFQLMDIANDRSVMAGNFAKANTISEIAKSVLDEAPSRFALIGLAMGGMVALEIIRIAPERVVRLALLNTDPLAETSQVSLERDSQIIRAKTGLFEDVISEQVNENCLAPGPNKESVRNLLTDMAHGLGPEVFAHQSHALQVRPDQQATLRRIRVGTLVLCGEHEKATPRRHHQMMSQLIPDASLRVIKGAGDFPTLEQPLATSNALKKWLTSYDDLPIDGGHLFETQIA